MSSLITVIVASQPAPVETAVALRSSVPFSAPSDWPMQLGIALLVGAGLTIGLSWCWRRLDAIRSADWLLMARWLRSPAEVRAVRAVAHAADAPVACVLISASAFSRGCARVVETKGLVGQGVLERVRARVFGE